MEDNQLVQMATQTFCLVPEIYQQAFIDAGADFPDELVAQIKEDPEKAVTLLKNDTELQKAVIDIFSSNQEAIMQAAQEKASQQQMFKSGGKLEQGLQMFQAGGLTRKQAIDKAMRVHGYQRRSDARKAYRNAKEGLRREADLRGRELRGEARQFIVNRPEDVAPIIPERDIEVVPIIPEGPQDIVLQERVIVPTPEPQPEPKPKPRPKPRPNLDPMPEGGIDDTKKQQLMSDAWYEYQAGRAGYDQLNHNYAPWAGPYEAAYQHWMWDDFKNAWDYDNAKVKSDFLMHSPTKEELMPYLNAGRFTHGVLPSFASRNRTWSDYGVDPTLKTNRFYTGRKEYRADAAARPLPNNPADVALLNNVGSMVLLPLGEVTQGEGLIPPIVKAGKNAIQKGYNAVRNGVNWVKTGASRTGVSKAGQVLTNSGKTAGATPSYVRTVSEFGRAGTPTESSTIGWAQPWAPEVSGIIIQRKGGVIKAQEGTGLMNRTPFEMQTIKPSGSKIGSYIANKNMANRAKEGLNNSIQNSTNDLLQKDPFTKVLSQSRERLRLGKLEQDAAMPNVTQDGAAISKAWRDGRLGGDPNEFTSSNVPQAVYVGGHPTFEASNNLPQSYGAPADLPPISPGFNNSGIIKRLKIKGNKNKKMSFEQSGGLLKLDLAQNNFNTK